MTEKPSVGDSLYSPALLSKGSGGSRRFGLHVGATGIRSGRARDPTSSGTPKKRKG